MHDPLTPEEAREIRQRAGLTIRGLAHLFGFDANGYRTVRRFEAGALAPSGPVTLIYHLLRAGRLGREVSAAQKAARAD